MRTNNCDLIRRELDELMLDEGCSTSAAAHLKECAACREFHQTRTKLRRMVGSLGTVAAPADFDFRLRARLANDSSSAFNYWPLVQRGFAVAGLLIILAFGVIVVRNVVNQPKQTVAEANPPVHQESPKQVQPIQTPQLNAPVQSQEPSPQVAASGHERIRNERPAQTAPRIKRQLTAIDFGKQRAEVISGLDPFAADATTVFPIDASLQPLKLSLDDGRGNARTISVPTVRFGSQGMLPKGNQFAQKGIW